MTGRLHLSARHRALLESILRDHMHGVEVWAYGSRVNDRSHDGSDLDLVLRGPGLEKIPLDRLLDFEDAVRESNIPFLVEARDWARLPEPFHREIEKEYVVLVEAVADSRASDITRSPTRSENWSTMPLTEAFLINPAVPIDRGTPTPYVDMAAVAPGSRAVHATSVREFRGSGSKFRDGDTLFARITPCLENGKIARYYANSEMDFGHGSTEFIVVRGRPEVTDAEYAFYVMRSDLVRGYAIGQMTGTSGRQRVPIESLAHLDVSLPPLTEQRAIAHVLGTLDDKIELNRRMNETLEAMAQALFKSWFIDFDPVRAKLEGRDTGLPQDIADLFPGRLVDSEMGEIPEGWKAAPLDGIARFQNGLALQKFRPAQNEARLPVVKIAQLRAGEANSGEWASATIRPECIIEDGDILFSWSGSLLVKTWCGGRAALNQHLFKVTSARYPKWFYLHSLLSHLRAFRRIAQDKATTMGHIRRHHLTEALCVAPPDDVIARLSGTFSCLLERRVANELSSRNLAVLRDTLLPKLISGELRTGDAESLVSSVSRDGPGVPTSECRIEEGELAE